jgi:hypothetical protein
VFVKWKRQRRYQDESHLEAIDPSDADYDPERRRRYVTESVPTFTLRSVALVRSVRTPAGPRHRHVRYLASVCEGLEHDPDAADDFWRSAEKNLRAARNNRVWIEGDDLAKLVAALEKVVPRPDGRKPPWDKRWRWRWPARRRNP